MSGDRQGASAALLYILHSGNLYGTERMALATLEGMDEYAQRVIFAPPPGGTASVADAAREAGYDAVTFRSKWELLRRLVPWFVRHRRIDVIGTGVSQSFLCYGLAKLTGVELRQLQVAHGGTEDQNAFGKKRHLARIPVRMVAVSEFVRGKLVKHGVRPESITVIDNFIPDSQPPTFRPRAPYDPREHGARPVRRAQVSVVVVSRLDPIKRIDLLIEAVRRHGLAEFTFDVYGTGSELDALRREAAALPNVNLHGFAPDIEERLAAADFLLHLCPAEPFGLVILEAYRSKVVVIVPDAGGAGSLVDDGSTGLRFRADDVDDLCRVLEHARDLPAEDLQRLADSAGKVLEERYSQREGMRRYREALRLSRSDKDARRRVH